ncbi:MmgE/PrpD family protein [Conexibacter sp. CPCC 206217]|uniref:MmgE/PrpD family protein n=1 Tax=Conexibacter sp. CPCC 206217 TaxID=3064574 RepID=UPI00272744A1|nr:MmgE/PrpD family protein [Conexibacter sp. CPCC 206217]MDO8212230.1 MmgE/PrpD family protein [Conexibacter sp. CPCC 206217]
MSVTRQQDRDARGAAGAGFTPALAQRLAGFERAALQPTAIERARHCVLDWLATALTGSAEPSARIVQSVVRAEGGAARADVLGARLRTSAVQAALANGQAAHAIDFDDSFPPAQTHGSACVVSAAFALAQAQRASGATLLEGVVAGFEALHLIGPAIGPSHYARGFHNTGTLGAIGAAAAAGRVAGLDAQRLAVALGIAADQGAGLKAVFGTMAKPLNAGAAASGGVLATQLAAAGFTAPGDAIEAPVGFAWTHADDFSAARAPFADPVGAGIAGNAFKLHACCHATHSALEGVRQIRTAQAIDPDAVERISLEVADGALDLCAIAAPRTGLEGKFSLAHVAALALCGADTGPAGFTDAAVADARLRALSERVVLVPVADRGLFCSRVELTLAGGARHSAEVDVLAPVADAGLAAQWDVLRSKFDALATPVVGADRADALAAAVAELERAPSLDTLAAAAQPAAAS